MEERVPPDSPCRRASRAAPHARLARLIAVLAVLGCAWPWQAAQAEVRVEISGVDDEIEANIRASLALVRHGARDDLSDAAIGRLHARARAQIRDAMRPFGFYEPRIDRSLERRNGSWVASYRIEPGEPVLVAEKDVRLSGEGAAEPQLLAVIAASPIREGRRLRHQEHDRLRNSLQSTAAMLGYLDARLDERRLEVDPAEHTARVILHLETGKRYSFGTVVVEQDILDAGLIQRIILIREGDPFDANRLLQAQYRLTDSLYFASVFVETGQPDPETRTVPVNIETRPTRRQRIRTGIGYATDTRLRGTIGIDWRRLNEAGHSAGTELRLSRTLSEISGRYRIPIGDPLNERLLFRGGLTQEDLGDLESQRTTVGVSHLTMRGGGWQRTLFADILDERTRQPTEPDFTETLIVPGIGMEKRIADDLLFPRRGYRMRGEVRGSHSALGASTNFLRMDFEVNRVDSIGANWRFFSRSRLGIGLLDEFGTLPASQRFFAGGDQSVRGYRFNTLGPTDDQGNTIGGRHLVYGSLEAERRVWGRVALAAFVDAGNALDRFGDGLEASVGFGVNVHTPIGTLRVSLARSVTESKSAVFHLSVQPDL
jgi:translocation and assembly module TamA